MKEGRNTNSGVRGRKRGGRPKKGDAERRSVQLGTKLTTAESEYVKRLAQTLNLTPCDLTRRVLLGTRLPRPIPEINQQAWAELRPLADELRRVINRSRADGATAVDAELLEQLFEVVQSLRLELRGIKP
jgi:hypothetical protein